MELLYLHLIFQNKWTMRNKNGQFSIAFTKLDEGSFGFVLNKMCDNK